MILDLSTSDHISEDKAISVLQEYKRALKKDGIVVLVFTKKGIAAVISHALHKTKEDPVQPHFFSSRFVRNVKRNFKILEEHRVGTMLSFGALLDKLPVQVRNSVLDSFLALEFSKTSAMLKIPGGFHIIIGAKTTG
jgi:hypothetical protein